MASPAFAEALPCWVRVLWLDDPSRFSSGVIHPNEAMAILNDLFEGVDSVPELPKLYCRKHPPNLVTF